MASYPIPTPTAATTTSSSKFRVLLIPYFTTSHIQPFTELAISLAAANDTVEATVAVTPANVPIVQSLLDRGHNAVAVKIETYPFPTVDGIPKGLENMGKAATVDELWRIGEACVSEAVTRPAQETLVRAQSPDAIITDMLFIWNSRVADELGVPCVTFCTMGAFSTLAMRRLMDVGIQNDNEIPGFPDPRIRIPRSELPDFLRIPDHSCSSSMNSLRADCFGLVMNTSSDLEKQYCEMHIREGYLKRAYFVGPLALRTSSSSTAADDSQCYILDWLDTKLNCSVVYLSFGSLVRVKKAQLDEIAVGLESSGKSFLWVVREKDWTPPEGWEKRVKDRGFIIRTWAPQTAILGHPAVGAFVTQCGWNSILETVAAGVPVLTWPVFYEQFITERQVTQVLGIGERLWPDSAGLRTEGFQEDKVLPGQDVAQALSTFMSPGGAGDMARSRMIDLAAKAHAAVAEGGSSHRDLLRLVNDLMGASASSHQVMHG